MRKLASRPDMQNKSLVNCNKYKEILSTLIARGRSFDPYTYKWADLSCMLSSMGYKNGLCGSSRSKRLNELGVN